LSAGNGAAPLRLAPRLAFAIDPYCQTGRSADPASAGANAIMAAETAAIDRATRRSVIISRSSRALAPRGAFPETQDAGRAGPGSLTHRLQISMPRQHSG
jgi:hypothetical protein